MRCRCTYVSHMAQMASVGKVCRYALLHMAQMAGAGKACRYVL